MRSITSNILTPHVLRLCRAVSLAAVLLFAVTHKGHAQLDQGALLLGGGLGTGFYHGEFNSLQDAFAPVPGFTAGLHLQYNLSSALALNGAFGFGTLPYSITDFARAKYSSNFFGPADATTYPGSSIAITEDNSISISELQLTAKYYLEGILPEPYSIYALAGLGMVSFTPMNGNGQQLPTDLTGNYSTNSFMIPLGGGVEYALGEKLRLWAEGVYHRNFTDYLDGYAHYLDYDNGTVTSGPGTLATQSDHYTTFQVGVSYKIYQHEPTPDPVPESSPIAAGEEPQRRENRPPPSESKPREEYPRSEPQTESTPESPADQPPSEHASEPSNDAFRLDPNALDSDNDKISDEDEINRYGTNPYSQDSDNDGLTDGEEIALYDTDPLKADTDGDLLSDLAEVRRHGTSPKRADTDADLLSDNEELARTGTDPLDPDSDGDGIVDGNDDCATLPGPVENNGCPEDREPNNDIATPGNPSAFKGTPLDPLEPGARQEFSNIFFKKNSDDFDFGRAETNETLTALRDYLQDCEQVGALIEGHTSSEGDPVRNLELSRLRAERVKNWLVGNGVPEERILGTVGYGSRLPKISEPIPGTLSPEATERIRAQNRRITTVLRNPCE